MKEKLSLPRAAYHIVSGLVDLNHDPLALNRILSIPLVVGNFKPAVLWTFNSAKGNDDLKYTSTLLKMLKSLGKKHGYLLPIDWVQGELIWEGWDGKTTNGTLIWNIAYNLSPIVKNSKFQENMFQDPSQLGRFLGYPCAGQLNGEHSYAFTGITWDQNLIDRMFEEHEQQCRNRPCDWEPITDTTLFNFYCDERADASAKKLAREMQDFYDKHKIQAVIFPDYEYTPPCEHDHV